MKVDVIVVGFGLAGALTCAYLEKLGKTFLVFDNKQNSASHIAAGVYNPIVLKRFNLIWKHPIQMQEMHTMFSELEARYDKKFLYSLPVHRVIHDENEINTWQKKAQQEGLSDYMQPSVIENSFSDIQGQYGIGILKDTGYVDIKVLIDAVRSRHQNHFVYNEFEYENLKSGKDDLWQYDQIEAKKIVFAEGVNVRYNPYFSFIPIEANKGEVLRIRIKDEIEPAIWKKKCFLMPLQNGEYYVGTTYERHFENSQPTFENRKVLESALQEFLTAEYSLISHAAALRPTIRDRKPIIGEHPTYKGLYVLNGLGTRGTLNGPYAVNRLMNHIWNETPIDQEIDVKRFIPFKDIE